MGAEILGQQIGAEILGQQMGAEILGQQIGAEILGHQSSCCCCYAFSFNCLLQNMLLAQELLNI